MAKQYEFPARGLPYVLVLPQMVIVFMFFFWPAVQANRKIRAALFYKTMLVWPYAVATLVAGVLWLFMFNPNIGIVSYLLSRRFGPDHGQELPDHGPRHLDR